MTATTGTSSAEMGAADRVASGKSGGGVATPRSNSFQDEPVRGDVGDYFNKNNESISKKYDVEIIKTCCRVRNIRSRHIEVYTASLMPS